MRELLTRETSCCPLKIFPVKFLTPPSNRSEIVVMAPTLIDAPFASTSRTTFLVRTDVLTPALVLGASKITTSPGLKALKSTLEPEVTLPSD